MKGFNSGITYLDDYFPAFSGSLERLPFFHSCDAYTLKAILKAGMLEPGDCPVFNEKLSYLFYGKPAYKSSFGEHTALTQNLPAIIIFKPDSLSKIVRVFPCDSGAFKGGMYKVHMHPKMRLENFMITPDMDGILKTVEYFFPDNTAYYHGKPHDRITYDPINFEIESLHSLFTCKTNGQVDDRRLCVEVQVADTIGIDDRHVEAIILPSNFMESTDVQDFFKKNPGIEPLLIDNWGVKPEEYYVYMLQKAKDFMNAKYGLKL